MKTERHHRYKHLKTGHIYRVNGFGVIEATMAPAVLYERVDAYENGRVWIRPQDEFEDGRFETYVEPQTGESHRCGSRENNVIADRQFPGLDEWRISPNGDRTCSFCGSLHQDDFLRLMKAASDPADATRIDWTQKRYKWYVDQPGVANAEQGGIKFYNWHLDEKSRPELERLAPEATKQSQVKFEAHMKKVLP